MIDIFGVDADIMNMLLKSKSEVVVKRHDQLRKICDANSGTTYRGWTSSSLSHYYEGPY